MCQELLDIQPALEHDIAYYSQYIEREDMRIKIAKLSGSFEYVKNLQRRMALWEDNE